MQARIRRRFPRWPLSRLVLVVGGFVALFACLLVLGSIAEDVHDQEASALDALVTPLLHDLSNPTLDAVTGPLWRPRRGSGAPGSTGSGEPPVAGP